MLNRIVTKSIFISSLCTLLYLTMHCTYLLIRFLNPNISILNYSISMHELLFVDALIEMKRNNAYE